MKKKKNTNAFIFSPAVRRVKGAVHKKMQKRVCSLTLLSAKIISSF